MVSCHDGHVHFHYFTMSEEFFYVDLYHISTMSAGWAEEDEGRMGPQPVEQQERMLGNKHGAEGEHQNYITKIDGKHGRYIAKIGVDKIIADRYKLPHTGPSKIFHVACTGWWRYWMSKPHQNLLSM